MKIRISILLSIVWVACSVLADDSKIPPQAINALHFSTNTVLYALDGESFYQGTNTDAVLYGSKILGQTKLNSEQSKIAIGAFERAMAAGNGLLGAHCFDPGHALRVMAEGETYDFLLCYKCGWLSVVHKDKEIARVGAMGTPEQLNKLLALLKIPIPKGIDQH